MNTGDKIKALAEYLSHEEGSELCLRFLKLINTLEKENAVLREALKAYEYFCCYAVKYRSDWEREECEAEAKLIKILAFNNRRIEFGEDTGTD